MDPETPISRSNPNVRKDSAVGGTKCSIRSHLPVSAGTFLSVLTAETDAVELRHAAVQT
jgi:hypothetical protein